MAAYMSDKSRPLPNVWLGVSAENQQSLDERISPLLATPAAIRWLSLEPLLATVRLPDLASLDWVVVGGESGPGARPCHLDWLRDVLEQCRASHVPCFLKQVGSNVRCRDGWHKLDARMHLISYKGSYMAEWPEDLRVREWPCAAPPAAECQ
jgi:protein gp37